MAVFIFLGAFTLAIVGIVASQSLHRALLKGVMHSPMVFFDTTPLGRILNRFSSDIHLIDVAIPRAVYEFFRNLFKFITALITIVVATPIFLVALVPLGVFYFVIQVSCLICETRNYNLDLWLHNCHLPYMVVTDWTCVI